MGVERAVSCWYAHRQLALQKIAQLEATLAQSDTQVEDSLLAEDKEVSIQATLVKAQEDLRSLGPCPKPMMG
jgi:hypothetical protein